MLNRHGQFLETVLKMERMSKKFEALARGVLDECHKENSEHAGDILRVKLEGFRLVLCFSFPTLPSARAFKNKMKKKTGKKK